MNNMKSSTGEINSPNNDIMDKKSTKSKYLNS
jgi:hypothetical protein